MIYLNEFYLKVLENSVKLHDIYFMNKSLVSSFVTYIIGQLSPLGLSNSFRVFSGTNQKTRLLSALSLVLLRKTTAFQTVSLCYIATMKTISRIKRPKFCFYYYFSTILTFSILIGKRAYKKNLSNFWSRKLKIFFCVGILGGELSWLIHVILDFFILVEKLQKKVL